MGLFKKLPQGSAASADTTSKSNSLAADSEAICVVRSCRVSESRHPKTKGSIIVAWDLTVEASTSAEDPPGAIRVIKYTVPVDAASEAKRDKVLGNVLGVYGALEGVDPATMDGPTREGALDKLEASPFLHKDVKLIVQTTDYIQPPGSSHSYVIHSGFPATPAELTRVQKLIQAAQGDVAPPAPPSGFAPATGDDFPADELPG